MTLAFLEQMPREQLGPEPGPETRRALEANLAGTWCEPAHGVALHRCPSRLASFSWRAHGLAQGMCQPPDDGHLAEWSHNLCGLARFQGDDGTIEGGQTPHRRLLRQEVQPFEGGFVTWGAVAEGVDLQIAEGWHGDRSATHQVGFVALPDGCTVVGLQFCQTDMHRTYASEVKGLHLNLPNDLFNGFARKLWTEDGIVTLGAPAGAERVLDLKSPWACIEGRVGVARLYGDESLVVHRVPDRRGGKYASLHVDQLCLGCRIGVHALGPGTTVLDCGWAVLSGAGRDHTRACARESVLLDLKNARVRGVRVRGMDRWYAVVANWSDNNVSCALGDLLGRASSSLRSLGYDVLYGRELSERGTLDLLPGQVGVLALGSL
jgi:hypothetical protein